MKKRFQSYLKQTQHLKQLQTLAFNCSLHLDLLPINFVNNEFTNVFFRGFIKSNSSLTLISRAASYISTLDLASIPASALVIYNINNKLFKQLMKDYLEVHIQALALFLVQAIIESCKHLFNACFWKIYSGNLHIEYYKFC